MTRETAIEILKELWRTKYPLYLESDIRKALEMAIQSLEQEPSGDLISRQAVLDMWRKIICYDRTCHYRDEGRCTETFCDFKLFEYQINHMPSVKQEPCEDAISRDMALEKMADYVASGYADSVEDFEEYSRIICQLPSVNPQPICEEREKGECPYYAG